MITVTREILSLSNPSIYNIPETTVEDTARRRRRRGLTASQRRQLARRRAAQISARLRAKRTRRFRQQTRKQPDVITTREEDKQVGTVFRASVGGGTVQRVPIIKRVRTTTRKIGPILTRRQIRQRRLSARLLSRRRRRRLRSRRRRRRR